jgi:hypothetical protein
VVSERWAVQNRAQRVIYVENQGPVTDSLRELFAVGFADVTHRIKYPDDAGWLMAYENKHVASAVAGSTLWACLLQLWEFLEPASSAQQREWRIVNPLPLYSLSEDRTEAIAQVSPPLGWAQHTNVLPVPRSAVTALVCQPSDLVHLRDTLPENYREIAVIQAGGPT